MNKVVKPTRKVKKPASVTFRSSDDRWTDNSMLLFGPPAAGKTHFLGTMSLDPERMPMLVIDNDGGAITLASHPKFKGIKIVQIHQYEAYESLMNWLLGNIRGPGVKDFQDFLGDPTQYKTIAFENLGKFHRLIRSWIRKNVQFTRQHEDISSLQDYQLAMEIMNNKFLDILARFSVMYGATIVLTAHFVMETDDNDRIIGRSPAVPGQLKNSIAGDLPLVGYFDVETKMAMRGGKKQLTTTYTAHFEPFDRYTRVKNRYNKTIKPMTNPSYAQLKSYLA